MDLAQLHQANLTPRQLQLLKVISGHLKSNCYSPTIAELAERLHLSRSTIFEHIEELRKKGCLQFTPGKARSLRPAAKAYELLDSLAQQDSAEQQKGIEEMKKSVAKMPPDMQKQMQDTIKQMEAMAAQNAKNPEMAAMMKQAYGSQTESEQQAYKVRLANYEKKFPIDSRVLIASRLRQFLDLSKDIPFDAKLIPAGNGKMKFADLQLESKPANWKLCFRAGKGVVETARSFATEWLRQLEGK